MTTFGMVDATKVVGAMIEKQNAEFEKQLEMQLSELVCRGILHIEKTSPTLIRYPDGTVKIEQAVKLVCSEHEYIKKLEERIRELEAMFKPFEFKEKE